MRLKYLQLKAREREREGSAEFANVLKLETTSLSSKIKQTVSEECEVCVYVPKSHVLENASLSMFTSFPSSQTEVDIGHDRLLQQQCRVVKKGHNVLKATTAVVTKNNTAMAAFDPACVERCTIRARAGKLKSLVVLN